MEKRYDLKNDGVEMIQYPPELHDSIEKTAKLWQAFCMLPADIKEAFSASDEQWTMGYEAKDGSGKNGDKKENFDITKAVLDELSRIAKRVDNPIVWQFVDAVRDLGVAIIPMIEAFGQSIENKYDIEDFERLAKESAPEAFIRFLHYPGGRSVNDIIAEPHVDHSGYTFHLYETTEGCERLTFDGTWQSLPVAEGQAAAFAGMQSQLISKGEIKGLTHRVLANETSSKMGRYAIVCFVALKGVAGYDRKTHGRLQEKTPGFNYAMNAEEFATLFK